VLLQIRHAHTIVFYGHSGTDKSTNVNSEI